MKVLFAITLLTLTLTASAFEFKLGNVSIPERVLMQIHATLEHHCASDVNYVKSLNLISYKVELVRIDQGYKENQYNLKFNVIYTDKSLPKNHTFSARVVDQLEDRSGELQTYVLDYKTTSCN